MACLVATVPIAPGNELPLERGEEAFGDGIVPAVAFATHARPKPVRLEELAVRTAGVLNAAIGMMQEPWRWTPRGEGHAERTERKLGG